MGNLTRFCTVSVISLTLHEHHILPWTVGKLTRPRCGGNDQVEIDVFIQDGMLGRESLKRCQDHHGIHSAVLSDFEIGTHVVK